MGSWSAQKRLVTAVNARQQEPLWVSGCLRAKRGPLYPVMEAWTAEGAERSQTPIAHRLEEEEHGFYAGLRFKRRFMCSIDIPF